MNFNDPFLQAQPVKPSTISSTPQNDVGPTVDFSAPVMPSDERKSTIGVRKVPNKRSGVRNKKNYIYNSIPKSIIFLVGCKKEWIRCY